MIAVSGRFNGIRSHVAEAARHSDAIRPDEIFRIVVRRIGVVFVSIPLLLGSFIEIGIWKQAQPYHARRITVVGARRNVFAASAVFHAGIFRLVLERIGRTIGGALVEPQAKTVGIG